MRRCTGPTVRVLLFAVGLALILAACSHAPTNNSYYLEHPDARDAKLKECTKLYAPANDPECNAAMDADARAVAAEHGPPFHGHNVAWYRAHQMQAALEGGYCNSLPKPRTDPDCAAAEKGTIRF